MKSNKDYAQFITELKQDIIQSKYIASRLANRQQLLLYYLTGKMLFEKITAQKWGTKVVDQIAKDLQQQLPGLRGFSRRNLFYMKQFYIEYLYFIIVQSPTAQMQDFENQSHIILPSHMAKLYGPEFETFFGISFTHHILLLNKDQDSIIIQVQRNDSNKVK
jgi:DUF1016 N-terminal domain